MGKHTICRMDYPLSIGDININNTCKDMPVIEREAIKNISLYL